MKNKLLVKFESGKSGEHLAILTAYSLPWMLFKKGLISDSLVNIIIKVIKIFIQKY